jgi:hypothetical protein
LLRNLPCIKLRSQGGQGVMRERTLYLNMIVRNETENLRRCLDAVAAHIACWSSGIRSNDGTQDFIRAFFAARDIGVGDREAWIR